MRRGPLVSLVAVATLAVACPRQHASTPAGARLLNWTRAGYSNVTLVDDGPDSTDRRRVEARFADGLRVTEDLAITHGSATATYHDGSRGHRDVPRRITATLVDAVPTAVTTSCELDVSGPGEARPTALYASCSIWASQPPTGGPSRLATFTVYGDGSVEPGRMAGSTVVVTPLR